MTVWFRSLQNIQKRKKILKTLDARSKKPRGGELTLGQSLLEGPVGHGRPWRKDRSPTRGARATHHQFGTPQPCEICPVPGFLVMARHPRRDPTC